MLDLIKCIREYVLPLIGLSLYFIDIFFCCVKTSLIQSHTSIFSFVFLPGEIIFDKILLQAMSEILLPMFSRIFMLLGLTVKSLIHFEFILVGGVRRWSNFIFLHLSSNFSNTIYWINCMCLLPLLNINLLKRYGFISGLPILFYWSMCLFFCHYHFVLITVAL